MGYDKRLSYAKLFRSLRNHLVVWPQKLMTSPFSCFPLAYTPVDLQHIQVVATKSHRRKKRRVQPEERPGGLNWESTYNSEVPLGLVGKRHIPHRMHISTSEIEWNTASFNLLLASQMHAWNL